MIPKTDGMLTKPQASEPVRELKGLAEGVWPDEVASVDLIKELRRRCDFKATDFKATEKP